MGAVRVRHLDRVQLRVQPVDVVGHPVVGQPLDEAQPGRHDDLDLLVAAALDELVDLLGLHVGPVDGVPGHVRGRGHHVPDGDRHGDLLQRLLLQVGRQHGDAVGDDDVCGGAVLHLAVVLVVGEGVPVYAGAEVGALLVGAALRALSGEGALVQVYGVIQI